MSFDIKGSHLMYIVGIVLGIIAVVYFGREIIADLSPTIKATLLLTAFPTFLSGGSLIKKRILDKLFYVLSVFSYLVFLWYIFHTFELGSNTIFIALVISSIIFIGIGYQWEKGIKIRKKWKKIILVVLIVFAIVLVSYDVAGAQPSYKLDLENNVNFEGVWERMGRPRQYIGYLVVKNDFLFSRHTNPPDLSACLYTPEKHDTYLHYPTWELGQVSGRATEQIPIAVSFPKSSKTSEPPTYMENIESLPIEVVSSCPDKVVEPKLVISTGEEDTDLLQEKAVTFYF